MAAAAAIGIGTVDAFHVVVLAQRGELPGGFFALIARVPKVAPVPVVGVSLLPGGFRDVIALDRGYRWLIGAKPATLGASRSTS